MRCFVVAGFLLTSASRTLCNSRATCLDMFLLFSEGSGNKQMAITDFWGYLTYEMGCNISLTPKMHILDKVTYRSSKSVKWLLRHSNFYFFKDGSWPPSWICGAHIGKTHKEYLMVFITVQILVWIALVVLMVWKFEYFCAWLENAYSRPQMSVFGAFDP